MVTSDKNIFIVIIIYHNFEDMSSFLPEPCKTNYEKDDSIYSGNGRGHSDEEQRSIGQPGHDYGYGDTNAEGRSDSLNHHRNAVPAPIKITDTGKQRASQDAVS